MNLHHLTTHSTTVLTYKWRSYCDHRYVTSFHPIYLLSLIRYATISPLLTYFYVIKRLKSHGTKNSLDRDESEKANVVSEKNLLVFSLLRCLHLPA